MTKLTINENPSTRVKSSLFGNAKGTIKTFAILTAENPMGEPASAEQNNIYTKNLKAYLKAMKLQYVKITGRYGNKEHSFIIFNLAYNDAEFLARSFKQESFFFGTNDFPSVITYYETANDCKSYDAKETKKGVATVKDANDFFSRHGDFKFQIDMDCFNEALNSIGVGIKNEHEFTESLNDKRTIKSRIIHRLGIYVSRSL